jgi:GntR family transcriptional repressor for pyruvate dehydrogenase complex
VSELGAKDRDLWTPVTRSNLSDEIADRIIRNILDGHFRFGEKLPAERDLAMYLDVGRPTIREALRALTVIGMVEVRPGEGAFVVSSHDKFLSRAFSWAVLLDPQTTAQVIETRTAIETELAGLAAQRATDATLVTLNTLVDTMSRQTGDRAGFASADLHFHLAIAEAADNVSLSRLLSATQSLLRQWIERALSVPSTFDVALDQHRLILAAIAAGDAPAAREAMRQHVVAMGELVLSVSSAESV